MMTLQDRWYLAIGKTIVQARLVTAFDGTDRESLDNLREALMELGQVEVEIADAMRLQEGE